MPGQLRHSRQPRPSSGSDHSEKVISSHRSVMKHASRSAFARIDLLVTIATTVLVIGIVVLSGCQTSHRQKAETCRHNLKMVGLAFRVWSGDGGDRFPMQVPEEYGGSKEPVQSDRVFIHFRVMSN